MSIAADEVLTAKLKAALDPKRSVTNRGEVSKNTSP